jgi:hypothetical protein
MVVGKPRQQCVAALAAMLLSGCFYVDELNVRPVVSVRKTSIAPISRGAFAEFSADRFDENDGSSAVAISWEMRTCGLLLSDCDSAPFFTGTEPLAKIKVPMVRAAATPVEKIQVRLFGVDPQGAIARPMAEQVYDVINAAPSLQLQASGRSGFPLTIPFSVRARVQDSDDTASNISTRWTLFSPAGSANPPLLQSANDPLSYSVTPDVAGRWTIEVVATDALGAKSTEHVDVQVAIDRAPCLAVVNPLPAPVGSVSVLDAAKRFTVQVVDDDLDVFPTVVGDPYVGTAGFSWSIKSPLTGDVRTAIVGSSRSAVELDPSIYRVGDVIELRVEISDRVTRTLSCADSALTCSVTSDTCVQRQTWLMEVR